MRDELPYDLNVGGVPVCRAIMRVEDKVSGWSEKYQHITRAVGVKSGRYILLETIFSKPTQEKPVPVAVVCVRFTLDTMTSSLTYRFEQESVRHKVGGQSLAPSKYEYWLDRIISDKMQVRLLQSLATPFEETRLQSPPAVRDDREEPEEESEDEDDEELMLPASRAPYPGHVSEAEKLPLSTLLANIFDAADEEDELELTHKEVADLLYATPLGLEDWDIKLLLTHADEKTTGKIEYRPFVEQAPDVVQGLLSRRAAYDARKPTTRVSQEAIELCYGEEIEEVARAVREAFTAEDVNGKNTLSRHQFRSCLMSRQERVSIQEVQMLMQMCKEDEYGQVPYDDIVFLLQALRVDALHNALVETDISQLRIHLIMGMRRLGLVDRVMPIWDIKAVLLHADQLCLSRMQIHVILSIVHSNHFGQVDVEVFLRVACTVIPNIFDAALFMDKATTIAKEKADLLAKQEAEELQGITASIATKRRVDEDDIEDEKTNAPDREAVEKILQLLCNSVDDRHRQPPTLELQKFRDAMHHESVSQCQLSDAEMRGFLAEVAMERGEVLYVEHIRTWVPIIFELRKSRVYDGILAKDWSEGAAHLLDLSEHEAAFPLIEDSSRPSSANSHHQRASMSRCGSRSSRGSRRLSTALRRPSDARKMQRLASRSSDRPAMQSGARSFSRQNSFRSLARSNSNISGASSPSDMSQKSGR
uniref:EF-hand domain-containing protein n=1 Tax=Noctiluca scintillans TaxID=2966 RepID=A0A7S1F5Z8_NOCSC|mmetsp:Transcript_37054/g.98709  ORF Transcript_37054/g.98709 Transcript_37054/m.98709 type:complete len:704 (+) Transcript_37054:50-2161(+)